MISPFLEIILLHRTKVSISDPHRSWEICNTDKAYKPKRKGVFPELNLRGILKKTRQAEGKGELLFEAKPS
ncbi:hypothetical protein DRI96_03615 [Candidatus Aerophobetes bacterium]|uniref:Uncharacterized protein n=1 Tax=Aerophobetes bacterium TaxID=2030807 RepID=A0A662DFV8_UNCAE|nr:MAG: hypothetical protein DRI96_03615 [Candidatus Aerophobetes bacterium]